MDHHGNGSEFYWYEGARHAHDTWWAGPLHLVVLILLLALLVGGAVWLARRLSVNVASQAAVPAAVPAAAIAADPAVAALRMRYAKGEVSREDFQHAMEDLVGPTPVTTTGPGSAPGEDATTTS